MDISQPRIFAVKRYALHDGPNIRTTIFFKGCPLRCFWCHNPEGIAPDLEIVSRRHACIGCRECLHGCPEGALTLDESGFTRNTALCTYCLNCVEICPALAHEVVGHRLKLEEVMTTIEKDLPFYDNAGGGVTFSGGEPLSQPLPLLELLKECRQRQIHTAVDTSGLAPTDTFVEIVQHTQTLLFDLKHMDSTLHKQYTGVDNALILENLRLASSMDIELRVRIPLLAGINDDENNILSIAQYCRNFRHLASIDLLPYHHLAESKYQKIGGDFLGRRCYTPDSETLQRVQQTLERSGHTVRIGG